MDGQAGVEKAGHSCCSSCLVFFLLTLSSPADPRHVIAGQIPEGIHK